MTKIETPPVESEIFTSDNTRWEYENGESYLVYDGSLEELSEETGKSMDELYDLLGEFEDASRDLVDTIAEIREAERGEY